MSEISNRIRAEYSRTDDIRDAGLTVPEEITCERDIVYGEDAHWQILDIYRPKASGDDKLPVIVSVHGGAWMYGDKERYQFYCMDLAKRGFAVVNFTYRLAPEYKFPASLEDTNLVMKWCQAHHEEYRLDIDNLFAVGDSAGAHVLCMYACILTNPEYANYYSFSPVENLSFKAIALNCGLYHVDLITCNDRTRAVMAELLPEAGSPEELKMVSPDNYINSNFPPTFFMTAPKDFLLHQAQILQLALIKAQVDFTYRFYCDLQSSLGHVFHLNIRSEWAVKCNDEECGFFRKFIDG